MHAAQVWICMHSICKRLHTLYLFWTFRKCTKNARQFENFFLMRQANRASYNLFQGKNRDLQHKTLKGLGCFRHLGDCQKLLPQGLCVQDALLQFWRFIAGEEVNALVATVDLFEQVAKVARGYQILLLCSIFGLVFTPPQTPYPPASRAHETRLPTPFSVRPHRAAFAQ